MQHLFPTVYVNRETQCFALIKISKTRTKRTKKDLIFKNKN